MEHATVPIAGLSHYYRNARRGNIKAIAESLRANGQYKPIVVNKGTKTGRPDEVLVGNHTLDAAIRLAASCSRTTAPATWAPTTMSCCWSC